MLHFIDSLKSLISPEMITKASSLLGEKESNVSAAGSSIFAGFMATLLKYGNTSQLKNILDEAGNLDILSGLKNIFEEKQSQDQQKVGDDFLQHLVGDKAADFSDAIAKHAGISKVATNRLVSMLAPVFAGFFGNKIAKDNMSMADLRDEIKKQKNSFIALLPADLIRSFDLNSVLHNEKETIAAAAPTATKLTSPATPPVEEKKKGNGWIKWLLLLALLLLLFFWWRSCENAKKDVYVEEAVVTETVTPAESTSEQTSTDKASTELTLPDGTRLQAYKGGIEDEMIKFLQSDEYKKASNDDLKKKWFVFDNIAFDFGSTTELQEGSKVQLSNIAAILKNFKDAKVEIDGFADKKGSEASNLKISRERAGTIKSLLEKAGVGSQIAKTEGFGEQYAKHSETESDQARAEDREIALRFVK